MIDYWTTCNCLEDGVRKWVEKYPNGKLAFQKEEYCIGPLNQETRELYDFVCSFNPSAAQAYAAFGLARGLLKRRNDETP